MTEEVALKRLKKAQDTVLNSPEGAISPNNPEAVASRMIPKLSSPRHALPSSLESSQHWNAKCLIKEICVYLCMKLAQSTKDEG
jgi:hypothetical protein